MSGGAQSMPTQHRAAQLVPSTFNEAAGTVEVVWTTGARRRAYDYWNDTAFEEELVVTPDSVDMTRFDSGAVQVLDGHRVRDGIAAIIGLAVSGWIAGGEGRATLKLSQRPELAGIVADIKAGIIRNISFGYSVERYAITRAQDRTDGVNLPLYRAERWTPQEISFVNVPADPHAGTRELQDGGSQAAHRATQQQDGPVHPCEFIRADSATTTSGDNLMPTLNNTSAQGAQTRAEINSDIRQLGVRHSVDAGLINRLIDTGATLEQARGEVLEALARRDAASGGHGATMSESEAYRYFGRSVDSFDVSQRSVSSLAAMEVALAARIGGAAVDADNQYRNVGVVDMARELLEIRGVRTGNMPGHQLIERALHTTSDFVNLLQGAGDRVLRQHYAQAPSLKRIFKASTATDFRAKQRLALGEAPALTKVNEAGEFQYGSLTSTRETYSMATFGRIFGLSRQALVNDDLDAFGDMVARLGRSAAEFEAGSLVDLLTGNPVMEDGNPVFHASHGNLQTGVDSALQLTALSAARKAMRLQKGLDGKTVIDAQPRYLLVPAALETTAEQLLADISPAKSADVNPFAGRLELVVDPRLDAKSQTAWYLASDPALIDTIEYSYLESAGGPEVFVKEGFNVDGVEFKVRLDFGSGVLDWRGLYKANGA